ncbi:MAG: DNA primase, partial [Dehalococcoidia bacterium]
MNPSEEIKQRLDIVDVISESVSLQRAGRNFKAVCPFHVEKTPSFFVFPDRGTWHCFGACATGGDIFAFVMKKENLDFAGALRLLAERAGIGLGRKSAVAEETERDRLRKANEAAALFFQNALGTRAGESALDYMTMRGIDRETAQSFRIGYAPDSWDALREHLKGRGFSEAELVKAGLLVEGERGLYDRFRHRLVVPISDERGRTVGFGSRILPSEASTSADSDGPKYLNTPQTPIFDKGAVLYALDRALEHIRRADLAVIVEGYMDVIAAHQHGNGNVVASMGTALTERQFSLLRQLTENIVLAFDPDLAGQAAGERGGQIARHLGAEIKVM